MRLTNHRLLRSFIQPIRRGYHAREHSMNLTTVKRTSKAAWINRQSDWERTYAS